MQGESFRRAISWLILLALLGLATVEYRTTEKLPCCSAPRAAALREAGARGVGSALSRLAPRPAGFRELRGALNRYGKLMARGGWAPIGAGEALRLASSGARVRVLRRRLAAGGDLKLPVDWPVFDAAVEAAVRRFQARHGLEVDGVVGKHTLAELDLAVQARIRQLEVNLERLRWLPNRFGDEYVLVNIPAFQLYAYRAGRLELEMPVVVGQPNKPTPILTAQMKYVVFSPYWNVPPKIATQEIWPQLVADQGYLGRKNYEIVTASGEPFDADRLSAEQLVRGGLRIRQRPGRQNSLGGVKFIFPNRHDVYLHDTPEDRLFHRARRDFSHGCVRVARPAELAAWVLRGRWSRERILTAMGRDQEEHVRLAEAIPVFMVYRTAWVDREQIVHFRRDIYGLDAARSRALDRMERRRPQPEVARATPAPAREVDAPGIIAGYGSGAQGVGPGLELRASDRLDSVAGTGPGGAAAGGDDTGAGTL